MDTEITVEEIDFGVMCRACALRFDLSVLRDITPPIRDAFLFCTGIEVDLLSEDMPMHFCGTCYSRADNASQFKLQCQQSEEKLRSLLADKRARLVFSTPEHVDNDEPAEEEFAGDSSRSSRLPQQCDETLRSLLAAKRARLLSSTPKRIDDDEPAEELGDGSSRLSNLTLLELEMPLTPIGSDDRFVEVLNQDVDASQNSDDVSSMTNFINEILQENDNPKCNGSDKQNQDHIINPDSVLSFLNCQESDPRCSESILDESFSLIDNLNVSVNKEPNAPNDVNKELAYDDIITTNAAIPAKTYKYNNNSEMEYCIFDIDKTPERDVQRINCDGEWNVTRPLTIVVTDYIKLAMPERAVLEDLKELGYVRCRYCFEPFRDAKDVYGHLAKKHETECLKHADGFDFTRALHPELWINEKLREKGFVRCKIKLCNRKFFSAKTLYVHSKQKHGEKELKSEILGGRIHDLIRENCKNYYICDYCGKEYKHRIPFCRHMKSHRNGNNDYIICKDCGRSFKKRSSHLQHMKSHIIRIPPSMQTPIAVNDAHPKPKYLCTICGKSLSNQWNLRAHIERHTPGTRLACHVCNKEFFVPKDFKRHVKTHMKYIHYKCNRCEKTFSRSDYLVKHLRRVHSGDCTYTCVKCGHRFQYEANLKNHLRNVHNNGITDPLAGDEDIMKEKTVIKTEWNESNVEMRDADEKCKFYARAKCTICEKTFSRPDYLTKHFRRMHSGDCVHVCTVCDNRFPYEVLLKKHLNKVHKTHKVHTTDPLGGHYGYIMMEKTVIKTELEG